MTEFSHQDLSEAHACALNKWSTPNKHFTSGFDPRSSDNALLTLMSGGLRHAQQNDWLNAGRRLIDKTYVQILFVTQGLTDIPFINAELTAASLDNFIRDHIAPSWIRIHDTQGNNRNELATELIHIASRELFGSLESEIAASHLLFYLCPSLPIVPLSDDQDYSSHHDLCRKDLNFHKSFLGTEQVPQASYGEPDEIKRIDSVLNETDWWLRNVMKMAMSNSSRQTESLIFTSV